MDNIIFVTPSLKTGGGNRVFVELANSLCEQHNVSVLFPNNSVEHHTFSENSAVRFVKIGQNASTKLGKIFNLFRCVYYINRYLDGSILIVTDPLFCLLLTFIKDKERIFRFIQADDYRIFDDGAILGKGLLLGIYKRLCLRGYKQPVKYIFNSQFVYDKFCMDSMRKDVPFRKVYPAINRQFFNAEYRKTSTDNSICLVARKHPLKGLQTFINVYRNLPEDIRRHLGMITLISHDDLSSFDTAGMRIVKPTSDKDIADIYKSSDIFISTSWWEGFGLPPLEAMACGCAVICSDSGGVNEYAKPNRNCLMFQPKDENGLIESLKRMIADENLRKNLISEGIKTAENFTWEESAEQLLKIIS